MANEFHYCVSFNIVHPTLDPRSVTKKLVSLRPKIETMAGDERRGRDGKPLIPKRTSSLSAWSADLHDEPRLYSGTKPLSAFIMECLTKLEGHEDFFSKIRQEGKVALSIGWFSDSNYSAEVLNADALKKCGELGVDIELNCYWHPDAMGSYDLRDKKSNI